LETPYKKWLNEDVGILSPTKNATAFKRMATDDERQTFIEGFWLRRDPTPDTEENEFKEEHYRRIEWWSWAVKQLNYSTAVSPPPAQVYSHGIPCGPTVRDAGD